MDGSVFEDRLELEFDLDAPASRALLEVYKTVDEGQDIIIDKPGFECCYGEPDSCGEAPAWKDEENGKLYCESHWETFETGPGDRWKSVEPPDYGLTVQKVRLVVSKGRDQDPVLILICIARKKLVALQKRKMGSSGLVGVDGQPLVL